MNGHFGSAIFRITRLRTTAAILKICVLAHAANSHA